MAKGIFSKTVGIFYLLVLSIALIAIIGTICVPNEVDPKEPDCQILETKWYQVFPNGEKTIIEVPGKAVGQKGEVVVTETIIPDYVLDGRFICFRNSLQDVWVYIDGELRHEYTTKHTRLAGKTSENAFIFVPVYEEDAGKTLTVKTLTVSPYSGTMNTVYYGSKFDIWKTLSGRYGMELAVALFMLVLAVISIVFSIVLKFCHKKDIVLEYLGWGILLIAIWIISLNGMRQVFFPRVSLIGSINYLTFMLLPLPFAVYINHIQNFRYRKLYNIAYILIVCDFIICGLLHFLNIVDFIESLFVVHIVFIATIVGIVFTIVLDAKKGYVRSYRLILIGLAVLIATGLVEVLRVYTNNGKITTYRICMGLIVLLIMAVIKTGQDLSGLERERQQVLFANKAKSDFLASMSHEIRTPINAVLGMDEMILRESSESKIKEYALDIQAAGRTLLTIINDILDLSKIESGKMEIVEGEYDVSSMLYDLSNMIKFRAEKKSLNFNVNVSSDVPARLWGDDVRLRQILINLLTNAVKYTQSGTVWFRVNLKPAETEQEAILHFEVEDTGIGIKPEDIGKLFSEFERIEVERNRNIEGTGLGMPIAMKLLSLMGSELKVDSEYGKGSIFSFDVKQKIVDKTPIGDFEKNIKNAMSKQYTYTESFVAPDAHVLVVDDNALNLKVFSSLLKKTQMKITQADSGYKAVELATKEYFDIIFMDHMMPGMDGVEAMKKIKEVKDGPCANTPIIALTANAITGAKEKYLSDGFDGFLSKPVVSDKLEKVIKDVLSAEKLKVVAGEDTTTQQNIKQDDEEFPVIFGVDWEVAMMRSQDKGILKTVLEGFVNTLTQQADKLQGFKDNIPESLDDYRIVVHGMKSASGFAGIIPLSGMAAILEKAATDNDIATINSLHDVFIKEWRSYKGKLGEFLGIEDDTSADKKEINTDVLKALLSMLSSAMEDMDIDGADDVIAKLSAYKLPECVEAEFDNLKSAVASLDPDAVAGIIAKINEGM